MIDDNTMQVLKNFATINPNIVIEEGSTLRTISEAKNVVSKSALDVEFPAKFGIGDLNEFIATLNLVDQPNLTFSEDYVVISDSVGRSRINYYFSDIDVLTAPTQEVKMPEADVTFELDRDTFSKVRRAASVLGHSTVSVTNIDNTVFLKVKDNSDSTSNEFEIAVPGTFTAGDNFNFIFNINNLKMIEGDYEVSISRNLISHFVNTKSAIEYWVALEKDSTFNS